LKISWPATRARHKGRFATAGIDLSAVDDLTCVAYLLPHDDDRAFVDLLMHIWCPEAKLRDTKNKYRDSYIAWERQGWIHTTPGNAIDYDFVRAEILEDLRFLNVALFGIDRQFDGIEFTMKLAEEIGHTEKTPKLITTTNNPQRIGPICQEFERRLLEHKINHGGNPVLRWMIDNVAVVMDAQGNKKPSKDQSQGKIDGVMAALYALDRLMRSKPPAGIRMPVAI
jgi:phage terminase large subunit-like protein